MTAAHRVLTGAALAGIGGWFLVMAGWLWWTFQPVTLPSVVEPIPILNPGNEVAIGEPIVMELTVDKRTDARPVTSARFIQCDSGNLVTLTSTARDLPVGQFTLISDGVVLPAKVTPGEVCRFTFRITYQVNPIRTELLEWDSERFTVLAAAP